ncbi:MAG: hypothetical protein V3V95_03975 [Thermodesulfobacteriota bacterium]
MRNNNDLRIHIVHVGRGDFIIVELPDDTKNGRRPRFGLVDAGTIHGSNALETKCLKYLEALIEYRLEDKPSTAAQNPNAKDYIFEFICLTHPHLDHLNMMRAVMEKYCGADVPIAMRPRQFWDCGFRFNTTSYLELLEYLTKRREIQFIRVSSGTEFHYDDAKIMVLAPSVNLRNRYDTYGVDINNASIVLHVSLGKGAAILSGDAHFDNWGTLCNEFPRKKHIYYPPDATKEMKDRDPTEEIAFLSTVDQLKCKLLKVSHHGSKNGTSFEYLEKLDPVHYAIPCDEGEDNFPHPITRVAIAHQLGIFDENETKIPNVDDKAKVATTAGLGTLIYRITKGGYIKRYPLEEERDTRVDVAKLVDKLPGA